MSADANVQVQRLNMKLWRALRAAPYPAEAGDRGGHDDGDLVRLADQYDWWYCERAEVLGECTEFADAVLNPPEVA